ncbi:MULTISPECIES: alpha/beta hydrolase [Novilysobacter]|uniref:alpha/beta hydrolase n=1 Tax=Novilysobacter TaxID=3382699 RepID=UPI002FCB393D
MRILLGALAVVLLAYVGLCLLLYERQRSLIYFPEFTRVEAAETDFALARGDITLRGWVVNPGKPDALLYFGGNAERIEASREDLRRWFPGRTIYLLAYRGYGASDGEPSEAALVADALALYDHVRARQPAASIAAVGRSLGSGVAGHLASRRDVPRLVLITPFDSLPNVAQSHYPWMPVRWLMRDRYDTADALADYRGEVLIIRAGEDAVVPAPATDRLIASLASGLLVATQVVAIEQAGHNDIAMYPEYGQALSEFMR